MRVAVELAYYSFPLSLTYLNLLSLSPEPLVLVVQ